MQIQKKKKKKTLKALLLMNYDSLDREEIIATIFEIRKRLKNIFKMHIGEEESISPVELFEEVLRVNPNYFDIYKREFWWNVIKNVMRTLRSDGEVFIINKRSKLFVLKSQKESNEYKKVIDRDISNMGKAKVKADNWVKEEKWRNI